MSLKAYQQTQTVTETPRNTEYRLFGQVTGALIDAARAGHDDFAKLSDAIGWNRRLWMTLAADCASENNQLPEQVRAGIISLSIWVSKYSSNILRRKASLEPLIDVNKTIMEGLRAAGQGAQETDATLA